MRATVMFGAGDARIVEPTDAAVTVTRACICGSALWPYQQMEHSENRPFMGHQAIGVVEAVGPDFRTIKPVILLSCRSPRAGLHTSCIHGGFFGTPEIAGAQAEAVRIPLADGTLFVLPTSKDDALMPSLLTLSDLTGTGHHAAVIARVGPGKTVAVVGDGAVGLCGVIAARDQARVRLVHDGTIKYNNIINYSREWIRRSIIEICNCILL
jgi:threonine dehydrogenase-like Zn-dependent dehydrogenase